MEFLEAIQSEGEFKCNFSGRLLPLADKDAFILKAISSVKIDDDIYDITILSFSKFNAWEEKEIRIDRTYNLIEAVGATGKYSFHKDVRDLLYHFILDDQKVTNEFVDQLIVLAPTIEVSEHGQSADEIHGVMFGKAVCLMIKPQFEQVEPRPVDGDDIVNPKPLLPPPEPEPKSEPDPPGCWGCFPSPLASGGCFGVPLIGCFSGCLTSILFRLVAFLVSLMLLFYLIALIFGLLSTKQPKVYEAPTSEDFEQSSRTYRQEWTDADTTFSDQQAWEERMLLLEPTGAQKSTLGLDLGFVMLFVWDSDVPDADTIDIYFNDILVARNIELRRERSQIRISNYVLDEINTMTIYTKSQGRAGLASVGYAFCAECGIITGACTSEEFATTLQVGQTAIHHLYVRTVDSCLLQEGDLNPNE
jgi:hypothetical protein